MGLVQEAENDWIEVKAKVSTFLHWVRHPGDVFMIQRKFFSPSVHELTTPETPKAETPPISLEFK